MKHFPSLYDPHLLSNHFMPFVGVTWTGECLSREYHTCFCCLHIPDECIMKFRCLFTMLIYFDCSMSKIKVLDASGPPGLPGLLGGDSGSAMTTGISALSFSPDGEVHSMLGCNTLFHTSPSHIEILFFCITFKISMYQRFYFSFQFHSVILAILIYS